MTKPINIPIDMGIKPKVTLNLTNTKTGEVQTMSMGAPEGMILNHYLDWAMERGLGLLGTTTFNRCYLGTGDTPVQPTDTGLSGSQLAVSSSSVLTTSVKNTNIKFEDVGNVPGVGVSSVQGLAISPDEEILIVGADGTNYPGLRAFHIDYDDYTISQINTPEFDVVANLACRTLSFGGDYLFVGLEQSPWGKLYRKSANEFTFIADVPSLTSVPVLSTITEDGKFLAVGGGRTSIRVYSIEEDVISLIGSVSTSEINDFIFVENPLQLCVACGSEGKTRNIKIYSISSESVSLEQTVTNFQGTSGFSGNDILTNSLFFDGESLNLVSAEGWGWGIFKLPRNTLGVWDTKVIQVWSTDSGSNVHKTHGNIANRHIMFPLNYNIMSYILPQSRLRVSYDSFPTLGLPERAGSWTQVKSKDILIVKSDSGIRMLKLRDDLLSKLSYARKWTFPAGTGTGVVNEVAIRATSGTGEGGNNRYFLRFVLPEGFEKTDLHQLEVEVEAEIENPGVWEGVIPGGGRDGSDVAYRITMSENQFRDFITTGYNNLSTWFGTDGTPSVRIGTSNEDTDLVLDRENIRGEQIQYISSTAIREVIPYVPGSLERTIRLFLEVDQGNGKIGEIVFGDRFCRVTFDPPLNKYDPEGVDAGRDPSTRLYMNLVFGWKREGE